MLLHLGHQQALQARQHLGGAEAVAVPGHHLVEALQRALQRSFIGRLRASTAASSLGFSSMKDAVT